MTHRSVDVVLPAGVDDPQRPSGGNVYDRRLCDALRARDWVVREHAVAGTWPYPDEAARAAFRHALDLTPQDLASRGEAAPPVVLIDGLLASGAGDLVAAAARSRPVVPLVHLPFGAADAGLAASEHTALSSAAAVVVTSVWTRGQVRTSYGIPPERIHVASPGADPAVPAQPADPRGDERPGTRMLCVAAVSHAKGHDTLVAALEGLLARHRGDWTCRFAGSLEVDPDFVTAVRERLAASGLAGRVELTGPLDRAALGRAYAASDILVLPSRAETWGMVVTEALTRGIPVVASRVGGLPEALGRAPDGIRPGLLVPADDPPALTDALERWLADGGLRARLRAAARGRASTQPGWDATAGEVAAALGAAGDRWVPGPDPTGRRRWHAWLQVAVPVLIFGVLAVRFGPGPFLAAFEAVSPWGVLAAVLVTAGTTVCSVVRWRAVAGVLGGAPPFSEALLAYYRSQLLNATLPGGVLGDLDRGLGQRSRGRPFGRALRAIAWERGLGQGVQVATAVAVLAAVPSPFRARLSPDSPVAVLPVVLAAVAAALTPWVRARARRRRTGPRSSRIAHTVAGDWLLLRSARSTLTIVVVASAVASLGYASVFVLAARRLGVSVSLPTLLPLALAVLVVAALPVNLAGWGPREGAAAWLFGIAGLNPEQGLSVSVLYGTLMLVATLPGVPALLIPRRPARVGGEP